MNTCTTPGACGWRLRSTDRVAGRAGGRSCCRLGAIVTRVTSSGRPASRCARLTAAARTEDRRAGSACDGPDRCAAGTRRRRRCDCVRTRSWPRETAGTRQYSSRARSSASASTFASGPGGGRCSARKSATRKPTRSASCIPTIPISPVWWTAYPVRAPVIIGWRGGPGARRLAYLPPAGIEARAIASLARHLRMTRRQMRGMVEGVWTHNWELDPFARGAYSYQRVGSANASRRACATTQKHAVFLLAGRRGRRRHRDRRWGHCHRPPRRKTDPSPGRVMSAFGRQSRACTFPVLPPKPLTAKAEAALRRTRVVASYRAMTKRESVPPSSFCVPLRRLPRAASPTRRWSRNRQWTTARRRYRVDPFWPKPLPNKWSMQQVVGIWVDHMDHVWFLNRGRSALPIELAAEAGFLREALGRAVLRASDPSSSRWTSRAMSSAHGAARAFTRSGRSRCRR